MFCIDTYILDVKFAVFIEAIPFRTLLLFNYTVIYDISVQNRSSNQPINSVRGLLEVFRVVLFVEQSTSHNTNKTLECLSLYYIKVLGRSILFVSMYSFAVSKEFVAFFRAMSKFTNFIRLQSVTSMSPRERSASFFSSLLLTR